MKKPVGGQIISIKENTELITPSSCNLDSDSNSITLYSFSIKNEDTKNINVKINNGSSVLLKPNEMLGMSEGEVVSSCVVVESCKLRWIGLI